MQESLQKTNENTLQVYIDFTSHGSKKSRRESITPPVLHMVGTKIPLNMDNYVDNVDNSPEVINISPYRGGKGGF